MPTGRSEQIGKGSARRWATKVGARDGHRRVEPRAILSVPKYHSKEESQKFSRLIAYLEKLLDLALLPSFTGTVSLKYYVVVR